MAGIAVETLGLWRRGLDAWRRAAVIRGMNDRAKAIGDRGAPVEHVESFADRVATRSNFDAALLAYLALHPRSGRDGLRDGRRAAMRRALDNRATWHQIKDWRRGWRPAPQWAKDLLAQKLAEQNERSARALSTLTAPF